MTGRCAGEPPATLRRWVRLLRRLWRLRRLQRYFGYLGLYLQEFPSELRDRLREVYPSPSDARRGAWSGRVGRGPSTRLERTAGPKRRASGA